MECLSETLMKWQTRQNLVAKMQRSKDRGRNIEQGGTRAGMRTNYNRDNMDKARDLPMCKLYSRIGKQFAINKLSRE